MIRPAPAAGSVNSRRRERLKGKSGEVGWRTDDIRLDGWSNAGPDARTCRARFHFRLKARRAARSRGAFAANSQQPTLPRWRGRRNESPFQPGPWQFAFQRRHGVHSAGYDENLARIHFQAGMTWIRPSGRLRVSSCSQVTNQPSFSPNRFMA